MNFWNTIQQIFLATCIITSCIFSGCITEESPTTENSLILSVGKTTDAQYTSIQAAIDNATQNHTVYVSAGVYYENIVINTSINLKGEDKQTTIINGNHSGNVVLIKESGQANISGFSIQNSGPFESSTTNAAIKILSDENTISNSIFQNNNIGIYSTHTNNNTYSHNIFDNNTMYGAYLYSSSDYTMISDNIFKNNYCGLRIKGSLHNTITRNLFINNTEGMFFCCSARLNLVYHNSFINNTLWNADDLVYNNEWDGGYLLGGNYWDDYNGIDIFSGENQNVTGSDGIGDSPYNITSDGKMDRYPLMEPIEMSKK